MLVYTLCPYCRFSVTVEMIEKCKESICLKSCHIAEASWSEFGALWGEEKTQPMPLPLPSTKEVDKPNDDQKIDTALLPRNV